MMSLKSKRELLEVLPPQYLKANKTGKQKNAGRVYACHWMPSEVCNLGAKKPGSSSKNTLKGKPKPIRAFSSAGIAYPPV